jgi:thymidylate kinase
LTDSNHAVRTACEEDNRGVAESSSLASRFEPTCSLPSFLRTLFRLLDESEVRYCVLHSWDLLPEELPNDLDLAVHPEDKHKLSSIFEHLRKQGYVCFQCLNHSKNGHFFVFSWSEGSKVKTAAVDLVFDHRRSGLVLAKSERIVAERERHGDFWVASAQTEFAYLLAKKAWKGRASASQSIRLSQLAEGLGPVEAEKIAGEIFPREWKKLAVEACLNQSIASDLVNARAKFWKTAWTRRPLQLIRYLAADLRRVVERWVHPTGILVAILGPDGVGKSTVIASLARDLQLGFWGRHQVFHWRPQKLFRGRDVGINTTPHAKSSRGAILSMAYLTAFFLDHWFGYLFVVRPALARSNFVLFDRYFHDVLVDPRRYRYGGPKWFVRLLSHLVPEPDLVILLDADQQLIFSRKAELPLDEIGRQRQCYQRLQFNRAQKVVVHADVSIGSTIVSTSNAITDFMRRRLIPRLREWHMVTN